MTEPVTLAELWRGDFLEGVHRGHAVIVDEAGEIVDAWGDPETLVFPRSACKMLQALPLVESGAADRAGLGKEELALACASHKAAHGHTERVERWLASIGMCEADLRCGPQVPEDREAREELRAEGRQPCQLHNNCSGKHTGFLTLARELGGGAEYIDADHPVQRAVRAAIEEMAEETTAGFGIDGCSAPNFVISLHGFARAMARMAAPDRLGGVREEAARRLVGAMAAHPFMIGGHDSPSTALTEAAGGRAVAKSGAEGVFSAILPEARLGIALKIEDGADRASRAVIAALLARLGVLAKDHPAVASLTDAVQPNRRGVAAARLVAAETLF